MGSYDDVRDAEGPFLEVADDPRVWVTGPTPSRPVDDWLPWAVETTCDNLNVDRDDSEQREYVTDVLRLIGTREVSPLPFLWTQWRHIERVPLILYAGHVPREPESEGDVEDVAEAWLRAEASDPVEPPIRDDLEAPAGMTLRRSLVYGRTGRHTLAVAARYVVDTDHPDAVVLAHIASGTPGDVLEACEPVEDFLRTVRLLDHNPWAGRG